MKVTFTDTVGVDAAYAPKPAAMFVPDWYKQTGSYLTGTRKIVNGNHPHTIKRCVPVFDAMTAGYIIPTFVDIQVSSRDGAPYYDWPQGDPLSFHTPEQAKRHPDRNGFPIAKWNSPWSIHTPRGYSCLFVNPMHNPNGIFRIFEGLVDTDTYRVPINFPFVLNDPSWEGIIPAGTPLAQVIPIKRENYVMNLGVDKDKRAAKDDQTRLRSLWFNSYKRQFWTKKEYR